MVRVHKIKPEALRTVAQVADDCPAFSQAALRSLIFDADKNELTASGAIVRLGRRVYIDSERFAEWIASHQGGGHDVARGL